MKKQHMNASRKDTRALGTVPVSIPLEEMSTEEARTWLHAIRAQLVAKMAREQAYLDRRAKRGVHTPTDDAYQADQALEQELLRLIDHELAGIDETLGSGG